MSPSGRPRTAPLFSSCVLAYSITQSERLKEYLPVFQDFQAPRPGGRSGTLFGAVLVAKRTAARGYTDVE